MDEHRIPRYIAFLIWYPGILTQIVLFSFADTPANDRYKRLGHHHQMVTKWDQPPMV